jgi:hypothetical protein
MCYGEGMGISNEERKQIAFERRNEFEADAHARKLHAAIEQFGPVLLHDGYEGVYKVRLNNPKNTGKLLLQWLTLANNNLGTDGVLLLNDKGAVLKRDGCVFVKF